MANDDLELGETLTSDAATLAAGVVAREQAGSLEPGRRIGRFVLGERLGAGGMGVVYAARDDRLERPIALKVLGAGRGDERARTRLLREAQAMARLEHPNVATVYEVGDAQGRVFVAMELIDGPTLGSWLAEERDWIERMRMVVEAGEGLAAAHELGLIHRDFKPANVMVGSEGRPRVLDFGLARSNSVPKDDDEDENETVEVEEGLEGEGLLGAPLTQAGAILGTPAYMSPEQLLGERVDPRSDQYSFCVTLYEALYGQRPFVASNLAELANAMTEAPPFPERGAVPRSIAAILRRGLSPSPEARWPSMRELLDALADELERHGDPEADVAVGRRQRALLLGAMVLSILVVVFAMEPLDPSKVLGDPWRALGLYSVLCSVGTLIVFAARRSVGRNRINRQLLSLLLVYPVGLWLDRVAAIPLGLAWPEVYILDLVLVTMLSLLAGSLLHRWFYALAGMGACGLLVACIEPSVSPQVSLSVNLGSLVSLVVVWRGSRDQRQAEAAMDSRVRSRRSRDSRGG